MKRWLLRLALVVGGLLLGVALAELIVRMIGLPGDSDLLFNSPESSPIGLYVLDQQTRVIPAANFSAQVHSLDYKVQVRTNSLGLRGPESVDKSQWVAVGDSFTMAVQVAETETFSALIGDATNTHLWNAGVDGYSTWQSSLRYQQISKALPIEGILLTFFTGNDFHDNELFPVLKNQPLPGTVGQPIPRETTSAWRKFLLRNSYIYARYRIWSHRNEIQKQQGHFAKRWKDELSIFTKSGSNRLQGLANQTQRALQDLRRATGNKPLMVAVAPPAFVIDEQRIKPTLELVGLQPEEATVEAPQQKVIQLLKSQGIPYCDLTSALQAGQQQTDMYFSADGHWTKAGHEVVAKTVTECLKNANFNPG